MKSVILVSLAVIATAHCGIIERGFDTIGDAAHIAHEGFGEMLESGKHLMFGKGIGAGPDLADQGIIPGMIHKAGDGLHLMGHGISHIFSGDDGIHEPLSVMRNKLASEAAGAVPVAAEAAAAAPAVAEAAAAAPAVAEAAAAAPAVAEAAAAAPAAAAAVAPAA